MCQIWLRSDGRVEKRGAGVQTDRQTKKTAALYSRLVGYTRLRSGGREGGREGRDGRMGGKEGSSSSSSIYFNSTTSISQYSNKCIQYRHNGKLNTFLDIR